MFHEGSKAQILLTILLALAFAPAMAGGDDADDDRSPIQIGYAVITPTGANTNGLVVFETFGERRGSETTQAGVLPAELTSNAILFVSANGRLSRNLGIAIANPGSADASVSLKLRREDGTVIGVKTVTVTSKKHMASFVTELFSSESSVPRDFAGTLEVTSNNPVALAGLRFRGENFSTLPITNLSPPTPVPVIAPGVGGTGSVILAHFAIGGGWSTEIVMVNTGSGHLTVRLDLFKQDGTPLTTRLNAESKSSFNGLTIAPSGVLVLSPKNENGDSPF